MYESEGGLVNKSIFTVQQHYHKQETTILNDIDSMILNLLSLHNHVGDGKFFTPPPGAQLPPLRDSGGGNVPVTPPLPTPLLDKFLKCIFHEPCSHLIFTHHMQCQLN